MWSGMLQRGLVRVVVSAGVKNGRKLGVKGNERVGNFNLAAYSRRMVTTENGSSLSADSNLSGSGVGEAWLRKGDDEKGIQQQNRKRGVQQGSSSGKVGGKQGGEGGKAGRQIIEEKGDTATTQATTKTTAENGDTAATQATTKTTAVKGDTAARQATTKTTSEKRDTATTQATTKTTAEKGDTATAVAAAKTSTSSAKTAAATDAAAALSYSGDAIVGEIERGESFSAVADDGTMRLKFDFESDKSFFGYPAVVSKWLSESERLVVEILSCNWADYWLLVSDIPIWEAHYDRLYGQAEVMFQFTAVTERLQYMQRLFDVLHRTEDVRDDITEVIEQSSRSSGIAGVGLFAHEPVENVQEHAIAASKQYDLLLQEYPEFRPQIEETVGQVLASLRQKQMYEWSSMHRYCY